MIDVLAGVAAEQVRPAAWVAWVSIDVQANGCVASGMFSGSSSAKIPSSPSNGTVDSTLPWSPKIEVVALVAGHDVAGGAAEDDVVGRVALDHVGRALVRIAWS